MTDRYLVAVGAAVIDEYYRADGWPDRGDKQMIRPMESRIGGMIPNAACVLAGYGEKVFLIDSMNSGPVSGEIRRRLTDDGLDLAMMITDDTLPDGRCILVMTEGERTILVVDRGPYKRPLDEEHRRLLLGSACVYTSVMEFRRFPEPERLAAELREAGVLLALDLEPSTFQNAEDPLFMLAGILFFNEAGLAKYAAGREPLDCIEALLGGGVRCVVVTRGADGCVCFQRGERVDLDGIPVQVTDTTGAGDTFNATFVHRFLEGEPLLACARYANAAAAHAVTCPGARGGVLSREEGEAWMRHFYYA